MRALRGPDEDVILFVFITFGAVVGFSVTGGAGLGTAIGAAAGAAAVSLLRRSAAHRSR